MTEGLDGFVKPIERDVRVKVSIGEFVKSHDNILASHVLPIILDRVVAVAEGSLRAYSPAEPPREAIEMLEKYRQMQRLLYEIKNLNHSKLRGRGIF